MGLNEKFNEKAKKAHRILASCMGKKGFYASSVRYRWQCWTRDFIIAVLPYVLTSNNAEYKALAKSHLNELAKRQKKSGQIPILFLDRPILWVLDKIWHSLKNRRFSFMLKKFLSLDGVFNLTPWTKDSEILYIIGVASYYETTGDLEFWEHHTKHIDKAFAYIKKNLLYDDMVMGSDWRDTKPEYNNVMLLTNNCFLCLAYRLCGMKLQAEVLKKKINEHFWTDQYYRDYIGSWGFDSFGNALAILSDMANNEQTEKIKKHFDKLSTPYGYKVNGVTLPPKNAVEAELMERIKQDGVIWPFISNYVILSLIRFGEFPEVNKREIDKLINVPDFFEYYDPEKGEGHGSPEQLWSAMTFLMVTDEYFENHD